MSVEVMSWVWQHSQAQGTDRLVLLCIADSADSDGTNSWPGIDRIAERCKVDPRTVQRSISKLIAMGELDRQIQAGGNHKTRPDHRPNRYTVLMDGAASASPRGSDGVTTEVLRGDKSCINGVTPVSPDPPIKAPTLLNTHKDLKTLATSSPKEKKRDLLFDALVDELGINVEELTGTSRGTINRSLAELRGVKATPEEIRRRCAIYRDRFPHAALTAPALAKHWPALGKPVRRLSPSEQAIQNVARRQGL